MAGSHSPPASATSSTATVAISQSRQPLTFEFTKRKRWAEILVTDLPESVIFVLSASAKILYCGKAATDILGWDVEELIDVNLFNFINAEDQHSLRSSIDLSLNARRSLFIYARLRCKEILMRQNDTVEHRELLFEITGRPYYPSEIDDCKCLILMARPYPGRSIAALNTFLELKLEKDRLLQRRKELRTALASMIDPIPNAPISAASTTTSQYPDSEFNYMRSSTRVFGVTDDSTRTAMTVDSLTANESYSQIADDANDDIRRRRTRRMNGEQYVCVQCGRTDSPEWRRGPNGPKTLCNACGLRWAKTDRKDGETDVQRRRFK